VSQKIEKEVQKEKKKLEEQMKEVLRRNQLEMKKYKEEQ
jgi:hypothetical protein